MYFLTEKELRQAWLRILNRDIYQNSERFPDTILFETPCTKFIKREKLLEWELLFDKAVAWGEDLLYNFRLLQRVKSVKVIDHTGYYYRINALSMTQRYDEWATERFFQLVNVMGVEVEKTGDWEATKQYQVFVLKQLLLSLKQDILNPHNPGSYHQRREAYRKLRYSEVVQNALRSFPYGSVRLLYKIAIGISATGSYGLLWAFYQVKCLMELAGGSRRRDG